MTGLLVSVRDAGEAQTALEYGTDLIDVKEPLRGALGAADESTIVEVVQAVAGRVPVSAALGELISDASTAANTATGRGYPVVAGVDFAKLGLAGCCRLADWPQQWAAAMASFSLGARSVAVAYADWPAAQAPQPGDVLSWAQRLGCHALLVDTFDKSRGWLGAHWPLEKLRIFVNQVRDSGLTIVLGGSVSMEMAPWLLTLEPDYLAIRGAVCRDSRRGRLDGELVQQLADLVHNGPGRC